jgi:hypothetical protein
VRSEVHGQPAIASWIGNRGFYGLGPGPKIGVYWNLLLSHPTNWGSVFGLQGVTFVNLQILPTRDGFDLAKTAFGVPVHAFDLMSAELAPHWRMDNNAA